MPDKQPFLLEGAMCNFCHKPYDIDRLKMLGDEFICIYCIDKLFHRKVMGYYAKL